MTNFEVGDTGENIPGAFLFVLDSIADPGTKPSKEEGKWVRDQASIEIIFEKAGLKRYSQTELTRINEDWYPVMLWALA